jgi:hypothetical protein
MLLKSVAEQAAALESGDWCSAESIAWIGRFLEIVQHIEDLVR